MALLTSTWGRQPVAALVLLIRGDDLLGIYHQHVFQMRIKD
jgi:hypothetical protein